MSQLELFASQHRAPVTGRDPYKPYDAPTARQVILARLKKANGEWVRRMTLRRATGMRQAFVAVALGELVGAGLIEFNESMPIIHPSHGFMGHTRGYRICRQMQEAA